MVTFELESGELRHAEAPATFYIPPQEARAGLLPGDSVKLIFRIEHDGQVDVERMWVTVQSAGPSGYVGVLDNQPYCTEELKPGAPVGFRSEHFNQIE